MYKIKILLVILVALIGLIACEDGASIKVHNQTSHNVYGEVDGIEFTVAGATTKKINVDTNRKVFLFEDGKTSKTLSLVGETYRIWDEFYGVPQSETDIKLYPGKSYDVFCSPNSASVKVINNSEYSIYKLNYRKNELFSPGQWFNITYDPPLEKGDFAYYHLAPQTEENRFFYNFSVENQDEVIYSIGNEFDGVELFMDEQHLIIIEEE